MMGTKTTVQPVGSRSCPGAVLLLPAGRPESVSSSLAGGTRANSTWPVAAVLRALPACGTFASHPLKPPCSHCFSCQEKPVRIYYILLYFSFQKTVTGSFSTSLSQQKASSLFLPFLGKLLVQGLLPAWCPGSGRLCCPPGCSQGAIPPCQQLQRTPRCLSRPLTCWLLTNKNTHL